MAKGSGNTRSQSMASGSAIERLRNSSNWAIAAGMNRYERDKNDRDYDFSDMANLTDTDKTYLVAYLTHSYPIINNTLRSGAKMSEDIRIMVKGIDRAIEKLEPYQGTVYRGIQYNADGTALTKKGQQSIIDYYKSHIGEVVTEKGYTSTGKVKAKIDRKFAYEDTKVRFSIESKTGRDLSRYNGEEREVLFKRGTRFKVISVRGNNIHLQEL